MESKLSGHVVENVFQDQYALVTGSRQVLFSYLETIKEEDLTKGVDAFAGKNIYDLVIHTASSYWYWLGQYGLGRSASFFEPEAVSAVHNMRSAYHIIDVLVAEFIQRFVTCFTQPITKLLPGETVEYTTTPFVLLTHGFTHEFHHKGQILSITRQLGYTPVDTDIIRF